MSNNKKLAPFTILEHGIMDDIEIEDPSDLMVYWALKRYQGNNDHCFPSLETLSEKTRYSKRSVSYALERLEETSWIIRESRVGTSTLYYVLSEYEHNDKLHKEYLNMKNYML